MCRHPASESSPACCPYGPLDRADMLTKSVQSEHISSATVQTVDVARCVEVATDEEPAVERKRPLDRLGGMATEQSPPG